MNRMTSRTTALALAAFSLTVASCAPAPSQTPVEITNAWVRLPAAPGRPGAAYFTLKNHGPPTALVAVESPRARRIELHDNSMANGMMRMAPLATVELPRDGTLAFAPGGKHAMLFGIDPAVTKGDAIQLIFTLRDGKRLESLAQVATAGAVAPHPY